jgi:hypothetical protein
MAAMLLSLNIAEALFDRTLHNLKKRNLGLFLVIRGVTLIDVANRNLAEGSRARGEELATRRTTK